MLVVSSKEDLRLYVITYLVTFILVFIYCFIFNHNLVKGGEIIEAVITRKYAGPKGRPYCDYAYTVGQTNFTGSTNPAKNARVNDTILVVASIKKHQRSRPISILNGRAIILADIKQRVVVNNMSADEKRELSDKLMADLRRRYWVKSKKGK